MSLEIRPIRDEELPAFVETLTTGFLERPDQGPLVEALRELWDLSRTWSAFDDGRLEYGAATLMSILGGIAARAREARLEDLADPLTRALAHALRALGVSVDVHYRGLLPLVAQYDGKAVVAEVDPETVGDSLRESLRLRPQILRRLGWHYVRVHAFDLYSDPAAVAARIAALLGVAPEAATAETDTQPFDVGE